MRLRRLVVEGFAQLEHVEIPFRDDAPNLVLGPNEAGKSHLMEAFYGMFFRVERPERFIPWQGPAAMHGTLEFIAPDGRLVRLERELLTSNVTVIEDGQEWTGKVSGSTKEAQRFYECLDRWLGLREREMFTATTFVRQAEIVAAEIHGIAPQIKDLITGAVETDYEQVMIDLTAQLDALRMKPRGQKPQQLEQKRAELQRLEASYAEATIWQEKVARLEGEHASVLAELETRKNEVITLKERLARARRLVDAEARLEVLERDFNRLHVKRERLDMYAARLNEADETVTRLAAFKAFDGHKLDHLEASVEDAEKRLRAAEGIVAEGTREALQKIWAASVAAAIAILILSLRYHFAAVLLLAVVAYVVFTYRQNLSRRQHAGQAVERLGQELEAARLRRKEYLDELEVETTREAGILAHEYLAASEEARITRAQLEALDDSDERAEWERVRLEYPRERMVVEELLAEDAALTVLETPEARAVYCDDTQDRIGATERRVAELEENRTRVERELAVQAVGGWDVAGLALQLQSTREDVARLEDRIAALTLAVETLAGCVTEFQEDCLGGVMDDVSSLLSSITDGRYRRVFLDDTLEPLVDVPGKNGVSISSLSRGVRDQLYFALRVSLGNALAGNRTLPLILDDPFVNFDPDRMERALGLLRSLVPGTQTVLFTCNPMYLRWLDPVLELRRHEPPVAVQAGNTGVA